jgi:hypothetical protein
MRWNAYNTLNKTNNSQDVIVISKAEFHELKNKQKIKREKNKGTEDKFMMMIRHKKTKKPLEKFHLTAIIDRSIHYPDKKTGDVKFSYKEKDHSHLLQGHDKLTDSRVIEATSLKEAQQIFHHEILLDMEYVEYSVSGRVNVDNVQFIVGPVVGSQITSSNPSTMPLRQL